jgi:hypothetical protein
MFAIVFNHVKDGFTSCNLHFTVFVIKLGDNYLTDLVEVFVFLRFKLKSCIQDLLVFKTMRQRWQKVRKVRCVCK